MIRALNRCVVGLLLVASAISAEPAPQVGPRLLVCGWGFPAIICLDEHGGEVWRIPTDGRQIEAWLLDADTVLYTGSSYVREVRRDAQQPGKVVTVWERRADPGTETDGCQPLPGNRVLICQSGKGRLDLLELERGSLAEQARVSLVDARILRGAHDNSRQVRKTTRGTYLVGLMGQTKEGGLEIDAAGTVIRRFPEARFSVVEMPGGGYLGAGGDNGCLIGYDAQGTVIWRLGAADLPEFGLRFCAGVHANPDGSILVANWGGHQATTGPCLGLIAPDRKRLIWSLRLKPANRVAGFMVLPAPDDRKTAAPHNGR